LFTLLLASTLTFQARGLVLDSLTRIRPRRSRAAVLVTFTELFVYFPQSHAPREGRLYSKVRLSLVLLSQRTTFTFLALGHTAIPFRSQCWRTIKDEPTDPNVIAFRILIGDITIHAVHPSGYWYAHGPIVVLNTRTSCTTAGLTRLPIKGNLVTIGI
jgi:hypothetical protein